MSFCVDCSDCAWLQFASLYCMGTRALSSHSFFFFLLFHPWEDCISGQACIPMVVGARRFAQRVCFCRPFAFFINNFIPLCLFPAVASLLISWALSFRTSSGSSLSGASGCYYLNRDSPLYPIFVCFIDASSRVNRKWICSLLLPLLLFPISVPRRVITWLSTLQPLPALIPLQLNSMPKPRPDIPPAFSDYILISPDTASE